MFREKGKSGLVIEEVVVGITEATEIDGLRRNMYGTIGVKECILEGR